MRAAAGRHQRKQGPHAVQLGRDRLVDALLLEVRAVMVQERRGEITAVGVIVFDVDQMIRRQQEYESQIRNL